MKNYEWQKINDNWYISGDLMLDIIYENSTWYLCTYTGRTLKVCDSLFSAKQAALEDFV